jgi:hypothetical protein
MSADAIRDLAVVLATAIPVIVVAYFAAISGDRSAVLENPPIKVPPRLWPTLLTWRPVGWAMFEFGNAYADEVDKGEPTDLHVLPRFQIGTNKGFVIRSAVGFLFAIWPFVLVDGHPTAAQRAEAVALVLTVWNLQALIFYSSLLTALNWQRDHPATDATDPKDAELAWSLVTWAVGAFFVLLIATTGLCVELWLA